MGAAARLLVIGIDVANPTLLERWAADGTLPNLRSLTGDDGESRIGVAPRRRALGEARRGPSRPLML
jgi:hypothetical protein